MKYIQIFIQQYKFFDLKFNEYFEKLKSQLTF